MSDIHILEGTVQEDDVLRCFDTVYRFAMHLATDADAALKAKAVQCPAVSQFVSALGDVISEGELASIQAGDLIEEVDSIHYNEEEAPAVWAAKARAKWAAREPAAPEIFERRYRWYADGHAHE